VIENQAKRIDRAPGRAIGREILSCAEKDFTSQRMTARDRGVFAYWKGKVGPGAGKARKEKILTFPYNFNLTQ